MSARAPSRRRLLLGAPACLLSLVGCGRRGRLQLPETSAVQGPPAARPREDE